MHVCMYACMHVCMYIYTHTHGFINVCMHVSLCLCIWVSPYLRIYVSMSVCLAASLWVRQAGLLSVSLSLCICRYHLYCKVIRSRRSRTVRIETHTPRTWNPRPGKGLRTPAPVKLKSHKSPNKTCEGCRGGRNEVRTRWRSGHKTWLCCLEPARWAVLQALLDILCSCSFLQ